MAAADGQILAVLKVEQQGDSIRIVQQDLDKLSASQDKAEKSSKKMNKTQNAGYTRMHQGTIQTANQTKNFSKMQQTMDGGGGAGGLVRAYALLAANVFAVTAAFGVLSRSAQIDTLIESMERLEVVSGKAVRSVARDLQEASGYGLDMASALRSTSLAMSAGFGAESITELGTVAKNAAVSLGRNMGDALDRIFRGVIKVEPELLDEIGLFVRVNEASAKYASSLGIAAGELTEFQKRQAFMAEALDQGTRKFEAFSDIETDPYAQLASIFADISYAVVSFVSGPLEFFINLMKDNRAIMAGVFGLIAVQLIKMVIPAMGVYTGTMADQAKMAAKNAQDQIANAKLVGEELRAQHIEVMQQEEEKLAARAKAARTTPQKQLKVRGREGSKRIEEAMLKDELVGKARLQVISQRIADIQTERGKKQRLQNKDVQRELQMLKEEEKILQKQLEKQQQIKNAKAGDVTLDPGAATMAAATAAQRDMFVTEGLSKVATFAEGQIIMSFKNIGGSIKSLGSAFSVLRTQVAVADGAAKKANISFGFLNKTMMVMRGVATITAVAFNRLWAAIMGPLTIFLMLLPVIKGIGKMMGFGTEKAQALTEANKESKEAFEMLTRKLEHANEAFEEFASAGDSKGMNDTTLAVKNATKETIKTLDEQIEAYEIYMEETNGFATFFTETIPGIWGGSTRQKIRRNQNQLIRELKSSSTGVTDEMQKLLDNMEKGVGDPDETRAAIVKLAEEEANAFTNVKSAIDGARDSARSFQDSLIVKTDVDKPLASFKQITASLQDSAITEKERKNLLDETLKDNAVLAMLTQDQEHALKLAANNDEKRLEILDEVEKSFARQQELIIRQKTELKQIKSIQGLIKDGMKVSTAAVELQFRLVKRQRAIERESLEHQVQQKINATGLSEERLKYLASFDSIIGKEKELGIETENIGQVHAAITAIKEKEIHQYEDLVSEASESLRLEEGKLQAIKNILDVTHKLNQAKAKGFELDLKVANISKTGKAALTPAQELKVAVEKRRLETETAAEREETEKKLASLKYEIMAAELRVILERRNLFNEEKAEALRQEAYHRSRALGIDAIEDPESMTRALNFIRNQGRSDEVDKYLEIKAAAEAASDASSKGITDQIKTIEDAGKEAADTVTKKFEQEGEDYLITLSDMINKYLPGSDVAEGAFSAGRTNDFIREVFSLPEDVFDEAARFNMAIDMMETKLISFADELESVFGEEGKLPAAIGRAAAGLLDIGQNFGIRMEELSSAHKARMEEVNKMEAGTEADAAAQAAKFEFTAGKVEAVASAVASGLGQLSSVFSAYMQNNIKEIDNLIAAEKARDGKSKESLEKIKQLEKKKEAMKRKEFETNKKIMLAQAVASTAAGIAGALSLIGVLGPFAIALAALVGAMGMAQVAIISKMQYSGGTPESKVPQTALNIGKRGSAVDVSQGTTAGELQYLRGGSITGQDIGGAGGMPGGAMGRRGYADGGEGIVVGERGPEVITPAQPIDIIPNYALAGAGTNVNFTINAVDAAGVESVLMNQRGNIIRMIRDAANENGEMFLEDIDTDIYGTGTHWGNDG